MTIRHPHDCQSLVYYKRDGYCQSAAPVCWDGFPTSGRCMGRLAVGGTPLCCEEWYAARTWPDRGAPPLDYLERVRAELRALPHSDANDAARDSINAQGADIPHPSGGGNG